MPRVTEDQLVERFCEFASAQQLIHVADSHFGPDNRFLADIELALIRDRWPAGIANHLLIEAKSHHSKDSANTINKIFGQLLKETGKPITNAPRRASYDLGILIPQDAGEWTSGETQHRRGFGVTYYQAGFRRINREPFKRFGEIVNAKYVLAFSVQWQQLDIYTWCGFYDREQPIARLGPQQRISEERPRLRRVHP